MAWRSVVDNPFKPGHDVVPAVWAGRQIELSDWDRFVRPCRLAGQYERGRALLGEPGIGKSVLAARICGAARNAGDIVVGPVRFPRGADPLAQVASALDDTAQAHDLGAAVGAKVSGLLERVRSIAGVEIDPVPPRPNPHMALRDLLIGLGEFARDRGQVVVVHLDEMQNVTDEDVLSQLLVALGDAVGAIRTETDAAGTTHDVVLPIAVYLTGLSEFTDQATSLAGATFTRRFKPVRLRPLTDDDFRLALAPFISAAGWPVSGHDPGVAMTDDAIDAIVAYALGDPFLLQLAGKAAWDAAPDQQVITAEHVTDGWVTVVDEARSHVTRLLDRLPDRERTMLNTMASLARPRRTLTDIAAKMDRNASQLGSAAQRLEERGIIERGRPYRFATRTVEALLEDRWP